MTPNTPPVFTLDPHLRKLVMTLGYMLVAAGVIVALVFVWPVIAALFSILSPFIVALVVAYIFNPIVNFVQFRLRLTRIGGLFVVLLLLLGILTTFVAIIIPILTTQIRQASREIQQTVQVQLLPWATSIILEIPAHERPELVEDLQSYVRSKGEKLGSEVGGEELETFLEGWQTESKIAGANLEQLSEHLLLWHETETSSTLKLMPFSLFTTKLDELDMRAHEMRTVTFEDFMTRLEPFIGKIDLTSGELFERVLQSTQFRNAAKTAAEEGAGFFARTVSVIGDVIGWLIGSGLYLSFVVILAFYLLLDFSSVSNVIEVLCPNQYEERLFVTLGKIDTAVGGFIRGQLISAALVGLLVFIGLYMLGLQEYALLIGCIAGVGNLVPYLGPILGAAPAILFMLFTHQFETLQERGINLLLTAGLFGFIQMIDSLVFQPKIVGQSAQLHPIAVIIALAFGGQFGIVGMILAVPAMCIARIVWKEFYWDKLAEEWRKSTGKKSLSDMSSAPRSNSKKRKASTSGKT
jgi:predicted PurR-regulated permease PerM